MLSELVYLSDRVNVGDEAEIKDILEVCQRNNSGKITGALVYSSRRFLQYLEGDYQLIKATYEKISKDVRHTNVKLLIFSPIEQRIFPGWAMAERNVEDDSFNVDSILGPEDSALFIDLINRSVAERKTSLSRIIRKFFD